MNTKKIIPSETDELRISSLPSRPTAPASFGGRGYTASQMKAAFDRLPLFIIERFNSLLDDIASYSEGSLAAEIPTGILDGHTLYDLFSDICSGAIANYLYIGASTLGEYVSKTDESIRALRAELDALRDRTDS